MRLYICGPMTGYEHYNFAGFMDAAVRWAADGNDVITPFETNNRVWRRYHGEDFDPEVHHAEWGDPLLSEMFAEDLKEVCMCDGMVLLAGWEKSKGAAREIAIGHMLGKRFFLDASGNEIHMDVALHCSPIAIPPEKAYGYNPSGRERETITAKVV